MNFTYWDSVGNYNDTCYAFQTLPSPKWQYITLNITNGTTINNSLLDGYVSSRFWSWNETPLTLELWLNGTEYCSQSMANMTYLTPCDLTGLLANTTYEGFTNNTWNTTYFWFNTVNNTEKGDLDLSTTEFDSYIAIVLVSLTLVVFFFILADKTKFSVVDNWLGRPDMIKYMLLIIAGWVLFGVFDIIIGIGEIESLARLETPITALYSGFAYIMYAITAFWFIALLYLIFINLKRWILEKNE